jgi:hypothetical protein
VPVRLHSRARVLSALLTALIAAAGSIAWAQQIWVGGNRGGGSAKWATPDDFDGSFHYCRGYFDGQGEPGGSGWRTDYPGADHNFSVRLAELTRILVRFDQYRNPNYVVVALNDPLLFKCPILFMEDVGVMNLTELEIANLRQFFLKGGFLWVDDFWGTRAWNNWVATISRVLPPGEFPIFDIPPTHPIMQSLYDVRDVPQVPNINFWRSNGGATSERWEDSATVHWRGIQDSSQRLFVLMSHNTDIADTWEREGANVDYFETFSPRGYAIGVNVVLYALNH